jgi:hypothetical protein
MFERAQLPTTAGHATPWRCRNRGVQKMRHTHHNYHTLDNERREQNDRKICGNHSLDENQA